MELAVVPLMPQWIPERTRGDARRKRDAVIPRDALRVVHELPSNEARGDVRYEVNRHPLDHENRVFKVLQKTALGSLAARQRIADVCSRLSAQRPTSCHPAGVPEVSLVRLPDGREHLARIVGAILLYRSQYC